MNDDIKTIAFLTTSFVTFMICSKSLLREINNYSTNRRSRMTSKEYLGRIRLYDTKVKNKLRQIEHLKDMSTSLQGMEIKERVQTSKVTGDTIGIALGQIEELEEELGEDVQELTRIKQEVIKVIDKITNVDYVDLLYKRYLEFKTWEEIAVDMHYNIRSIYKIHGRALEEISKYKEGIQGHTKVC